MNPGYPLLPGGVALSRIAAYDSEAPDGHAGGTPHVHLVCTECYVVVRGRGLLQTLAPTGYTETDLFPGRVVWFEPGVLHRDINLDGELEFIAVMENAGLPEAGDQVLTLPPARLKERNLYDDVVALGRGDGDDAVARRRRDMAVEGFTELRERFDRHGADALEPFYQSARALVSDAIPAWRRLWDERLRPWHDRVEQRIASLERGQVPDVNAAGVASVDATATDELFGMCGMLTPLAPGPMS